MDYAINGFGIILEKEHIDLAKSFDLLDKAALEPFVVKSTRKITIKEVVESLGTEDYIQWELEDTEAAEDSPTRYCSLFITYYGKPDRVPHVPEECYLGGGFRSTGSSDMKLTISDGTLKRQLEARYLMFVKDSADMWEVQASQPIMYIFRTNDEYANSRTAVREALGKNLLGKHSFFSKIEWRLYGQKYGRIIHPNKEQSIAASEKLLLKLLGELEKEHWPQWKEAD